ncbi:hypothetical protein OAG63_00055 [Methylacidiphilales bacterium]|nr:hypothetical protein [Candidatus Methylacidiphilales bacterium]
MKLKELPALQLTISRDWLDRHSTNLETHLSKAFRRRLNDKQDLVLFTDFHLAHEVIRLLWKRKHYQRTTAIRAKTLKTAGTHSKKEIRRLWEIQEGKCYYSGKSLGKTFEMAIFAKDHIIPISRKGVNTARNIALCVPEINSDKGNQSLQHFIKRKRISKKQQLIMLKIDAYRTKDFAKMKPTKSKVIIGERRIFQYFGNFRLVQKIENDIAAGRTKPLSKVINAS